MRNIAVLVISLTLCIVAEAADKTHLYCGFYPYKGVHPNVRLSKSLMGFGNQLVEIDPNGTGEWEKVKVLKADDYSITYKDGWGYTNDKNCKDEKFNSLNFCHTVKVIFKAVVRNNETGKDIVRTKEYYQTDCCVEKKQRNAGDDASNLRRGCAVLRDFLD